MTNEFKNCAIYTRKSSEEGLEQGFNSLDAQREACLAYIASQKAEGWRPVSDEYSDGGFSGGNLDRPALKRLIEDIKAGKVQTIVVYKIDRLTRSLMDFAKLVEVFDAYGVTFVSVTQSFNTTTSMGRLTLNVLLSFAQFEREVAGERIRDKIAASKRKGMWMGGTVPLGYDVKDRHLVVNVAEAERVKLIFAKYLELGCVRRLKDYLDVSGNRTKAGCKFSRGVLYWLLQNPVYIGKTRHKQQVHMGLHPPIIEMQAWDDTQRRLSDQTARPRGSKGVKQHHLLQGRLFDQKGTLYTPTFTSKGGRRYGYYVSQNKIQSRAHMSQIVSRIPAQEIEELVERKVKTSLATPEKLAEALNMQLEQDFIVLKMLSEKFLSLNAQKIVTSTVKKVVIGADEICILLDQKKLRDLVESQLRVKLASSNGLSEALVRVPYSLRKSTRGAAFIQESLSNDILNLPQPELRDLVRGIAWRDEHFQGATVRDIARREKHSEVYVGRLIHKTFHF